MFDGILVILDYIFPVYIIRREEVLVIEDRRPTRTMFFSIAGLLAIVAFGIWGWFSHRVVLDTFTFTLFGGAVAVALFFCIRGNFRETYIFDKSKDTYFFTRQSVFKKDVIQGSASQFRAVEVIDKVTYTDDDEVHTFHAALLQQPGLLLGTDETVILRESAPIYNRRQTEERIARVLSSFLDVTNVGQVED
ncbi:MAG: hypothetical protein ABI999_14220 [Acidobacteriota bacterium]